MKLTLLCEMCHVKHFETRLGTFELDDLKWPMDLSIFKSHAPNLLPDPFPVGLEWKDTRCRQCRSRPFLNFIPQQDGTVMLIDGKRAEKGAEGRLLTLEAGYIPIFGYPGGAFVDPLARLMVDDPVLIPPAKTPQSRGFLVCHSHAHLELFSLRRFLVKPSRQQAG